MKEMAVEELDESGSTAGVILEAFSGLPEPQRARIEAECQAIESMILQARVTALIDEATGSHKTLISRTPSGNKTAPDHRSLGRGDATRLDEFFADAERRTLDLPVEQRKRTIERLRRARALICGTDPLERLDARQRSIQPIDRGERLDRS